MASTLGQAPWRADLLSDLSTMNEAKFSLATVSQSASSTRPHVRTVVFRSLFASLQVDDRNEADLNPPAYESDLLTVTTDVRTDKVSEIFASGPEPSADVTASGGGGPVEAACFVPERKRQWRISGRAYLVGPDADADSAQPVRDILLGRMRRVGTLEEAAHWSFSREVTAHLGNTSLAVRRWFRQPPPGRPVDEPVQDPRLGMGRNVDNLKDEVVNENFRLVVIVPDRVDRVDLASSKRWVYELVDGDKGGKSGKSGKSGSNDWKTVEVWP